MHDPPGVNIKNASGSQIQFFLFKICSLTLDKSLWFTRKEGRKKGREEEKRKCVMFNLSANSRNSPLKPPLALLEVL